MPEDRLAPKPVVPDPWEEFEKWGGRSWFTGLDETKGEHYDNTGHKHSSDCPCEQG